jgi:hypothetical protein
VLMRLGSLMAQVEGADDLFPAGDHRLSSFIADIATDCSPDVVVWIDVCDKPTHEFASGLPVGWEALTHPDRIEITNSDWTGSFDLARRSVNASLHGPWLGALDALLKTVVQVFALVCGKGLVLHASSVDRGHLGYVFIGESGAGKSTVARLTQLAGEGQILSDEMTFVGFGPRHGRPFVATLPFGQKYSVRVESRRSPLAAVLALRHSDRAIVAPMTRAQQVSAVVKVSAIGVPAPSLRALILDAAIRLVEEVPVKALEFRPSPEFWQRIDADGIGPERAGSASSGTVGAGGPPASPKGDETCS